MRSDFPTASRARMRGLRHARAAVDKSSTASYTEIRTLPVKRSSDESNLEQLYDRTNTPL